MSLRAILGLVCAVALLGGLVAVGEELKGAGKAPAPTAQATYGYDHAQQPAQRTDDADKRAGATIGARWVTSTRLIVGRQAPALPQNQQDRLLLGCRMGVSG